MRTRVVALIVALILAVIGGFVVVNYVQSADRRAAGEAELVDVLVVTREIEPGTAASAIAGSLELAQIPAAFLAEGAVTDLNTLEGQIATATLVPGEQIIEARFATPEEFAAAGGSVPVPAGLQEISIAIDSPRVVGGRIGAGDLVGVYVSVAADGSSPTQTRQVLSAVLVTAVSGEPGGILTVSFAVSETQAQTIIYASEFANIWLTKQNDATDAAVGQPFTRSELDSSGGE